MNGFGNFTARAQRAIQLAAREADRFNHPYIGTEHLLLGLVSLGEGVAVEVLEEIGVALDDVRIAVERMVGFGGETKTKGELPYTPRTKKGCSWRWRRRTPCSSKWPGPSICCWRCCVRAKGWPRRCCSR